MGRVPIIGARGKGSGGRVDVGAAGHAAGSGGHGAGRRSGARRAGRGRPGTWVRQPGGGRLWVADAQDEPVVSVGSPSSSDGPSPSAASLQQAVAAQGTQAARPGTQTAHAATQTEHPRPTARAGEGAGLSPAVTRLREAGLRCSVDEAELIASARGVVDQVRVAELARRGIDDPDHASAGTKALAQAVRMVAIGEIEVALGMGVREAGLLVRAATAPGELYRMVEDALRRGEASWAQVRSFYEKTATLDDAARLLVASALFGTDPALAAADRLDPDDGLHGRPWSAPHFTSALEAQVAACRSRDVEAERAARARAYAARRMRIRVHDDGTATMSITGPATMVVAAGQRVERDARAVNAVGDPRTLDQLCVDLALGHLVYATIELGSPAPCTNHAPHDGTEAARDESDETTPFGPAADTAENRASCSGANGSCASDDSATDACDQGCCCPGGDQGQLFDDLIAPDDMELLARVVNGLPPVALQVVVPLSTLAGGFPVCAHCSSRTDARHPREDGPGTREPRPPGPGESSVSDTGPPGRRAADARGGVAEVLGPNPFFISDGHARELALMPGTTLHRLVVDPRDGRLVERTIKAYRPDTDMRRQVVAADVYSRAPGSRLGSHAGELDHVTPYGWAGGPTGELNLALLAKRPHRYKTDGSWRVAIGARRDLTFTTLLGQVVTTRVHDYRTYLEQLHPDDLDDRRDTANQLLQAALADRARRRGRRRGDMITLDHTDADTGRTRPGPAPQQPTLDDLLEDGEG